jgi:multidrug resistance efflux pump
VADAAVAEAQAMLACAKVVAPFDGLVAKKWADVGDLASPGKPLVDIEDPSQFQALADVPDIDAAHVLDGEAMTVHVDALNQDLTGLWPKFRPQPTP